MRSCFFFLRLFACGKGYFLLHKKNTLSSLQHIKKKTGVGGFGWMKFGAIGVSSFARSVPFLRVRARVFRVLPLRCLSGGVTG